MTPSALHGKDEMPKKRRKISHVDPFTRRGAPPLSCVFSTKPYIHDKLLVDDDNSQEDSSSDSTDIFSEGVTIKGKSLKTRVKAVDAKIKKLSVPPSITNDSVEACKTDIIENIGITDVDQSHEEAVRSLEEEKKIEDWEIEQHLKTLTQDIDDVVRVPSPILAFTEEVPEDIEIVLFEMPGRTVYHKYKIKKYDTFMKMMKYHAHSQDHPLEDLVLMLDDKKIEAYQTPLGLNFDGDRAALDVYWAGHDRVHSVPVPNDNDVMIVEPDQYLPSKPLQSQSTGMTKLTVKLRFGEKDITQISILAEKPLKAMAKMYCKSKKISLDSYKFIFDDEELDLERTAADYELEDEYTIEVVQV